MPQRPAIMPSYLVTGASQGLGYAFVKQFASDPTNIVVGIARNKEETDNRLASDEISGVHIFQGDITDRASLKHVVDGIQEKSILNVDYLICNAAYRSEPTALRNFADFSQEPSLLDTELLESFRINVLGLINTIEAFLPLIRLGSAKKIIAISSGMADINLIKDVGLDMGAPYAISKSGANVVIAKYDAIYKKEGMLFISVCPGGIKSEAVIRMIKSHTKEDLARLGELVGKFKVHTPNLTPPNTPEGAADGVMKRVYQSSLEKGNGGSFISHTGAQDWL